MHAHSDSFPHQILLCYLGLYNLLQFEFEFDFNLQWRNAVNV
jgi:hypothetical protein